jgi:hypothetical protein
VLDATFTPRRAALTTTDREVERMNGVPARVAFEPEFDVRAVARDVFPARRVPTHGRRQRPRPAFDND